MAERGIKRSRCATGDRDTCDIKHARQDVHVKASFLTIPTELRDHIYRYAMPWANVHILYQGDSYTGVSGIDELVSKKGKGFTRKLCVIEDEQDNTDAINWIESGPGYFAGYENRHSACLYGFHQHRSASKQGWDPESPWPYALLFVCRQTYDELRTDVYRNNVFSFRDEGALHAFATRMPASSVSLIRDLRLGMRMGSGGDYLFHGEESRGLAVARAFTGLKRLHASLALQFYNVRHLRTSIQTGWKLAHWARGLLNFAYLPLEGVTIRIEDRHTHFHTSNALIHKHGLTPDEEREWGRKIRDQLLAPWDRDERLRFLRKHHAEESTYHERICGGDGYHERLAAPEARLP